MKKTKTRTIDLNPIANAVGKQINEYDGITLDTSKLPKTLLQNLAKTTIVKLEIKKVEQPLLPQYRWITYEPHAEYNAFGKSLADEKKAGGSFVSQSYLKDVIKKHRRWKRIFEFNDNEAWVIFSRDYYPIKIANLYKNINDWFELQFRAKVQDIATTTNKADKKKKENELQKYLTDSLLDNEVKAIVTENKDNREEVINCIKSFVLNPQTVLNHQFIYYNEWMRQEKPETAGLIKKGINNNIKPWQGRGDCTDAVNSVFSTINSQNRNIYNAALSRLPFYSYLQTVNDNIDAAFKYIDSFSSTDVSMGQTITYTRELGEFNTSNSNLYGSEKKDDTWVILTAIGIIAGIILIKRKGKG